MLGGEVALIDRRKKKLRDTILVFCPSSLLLVTRKWLASQFLVLLATDKLPGIF
jgi:hypothetical protein